LELDLGDWEEVVRGFVSEFFREEIELVVFFVF